jgi:hypothetical protein
MITCSVCKKFVKDIQYMINGFEEINDVTGVCKRHGRVPANYEFYEEIAGGEI